MKKILIFLIVSIIIFSSLSGCLEQNQDKDNTENENNNQNQNNVSDNQITNTSSLTTKPLLWEIQKNNSISYIYGTIHLNQDNILTLPDVVVDKLIESDYFFSEIRLDSAASSEASELVELENGTLDDILPDLTANRLYSYLSDIGLNQATINLLKTYKVWAITTSLGSLENQINNPFNPSLDQYLWNTAVRLNVISDGLETVKEQTDIFDGLSLQTQIEYLNETLDYIDEYEGKNIDPLDTLVGLYLDGDIEEIYDYSLSDYDQNDSIDVKLKNKLFINRNYNFTSRIIDNMTKNPEKTFFFAIGAAHFYGEEGVLQLLENEGCNITRIDFNKSGQCDPNQEQINGRCYYTYSNQN